MSGAGLWAAVAGLSAAGAVARYLVDALVTARSRRSLPLGTAVVNLSGAFALGVVTGLGAGHGVTLLMGTALVGSYTTFSTWMLEALTLAETGRGRAAAVTVLGQAATGVPLAALGWWLGASL